ncbi:MAG TPA: RodZ domain-containing protein [Nitrospiraceae bacterium]|jgi:cytoskeletal protein RodZ|nr:RodZ domain-containing protein [Nitrospiraceae bacterium]
MESIGEFFRQVRETKGLTIDEVASKTRIRSDFVKALEEGNFAKLPDQVFARGFVRSYARSLGLDEEDAIHRFVQSAGAFYEKQEERERLRIRQAEEERRRKANRKAVGIAIGVAVLALVLLLSREQSSMIQRSVPEPSVVVSKKAALAPKDTRETAQRQMQEPAETSGLSTAGEGSTGRAEGRPSESASQSATVSVAEPEPSSLPSAGSDGPLAGLALDGPGSGDEPLVLDLEATELSWVVVQVDGGSPQEALLRPGEKARWKAQGQFTLTLGNAGGVRAELNGKPQKPFGPSGKVVRDIVLKR